MNEQKKKGTYAITSGYSRKDYSSRSEREKDYKHPFSFDLLVNAGRHMSEEAKVRRLENLEQCFQLLKECGLIESKMQFAAGILQMFRTPIPLADAAAICNCSRQWFRNLESKGRIRILRSSQRKCFLLPEDLVKILEARI